MRVHIQFDSATTADTRALLAALSKHAELRDTQVHLNGPEKWAGTTEPMDVTTAMTVLSEVDRHQMERSP